MKRIFWNVEHEISQKIFLKIFSSFLDLERNQCNILSVSAVGYSALLTEEMTMAKKKTKKKATKKKSSKRK